MIELRTYQADNGKEPYIEWLKKLDAQTRLKVITAVGRLAEGNTSNLKSLGGGVSELKINFGAGYRVYLGQRGHELVILLSGGTKKRQSDDIAKAKVMWRDYLAETERKG